MPSSRWHWWSLLVSLPIIACKVLFKTYEEYRDANPKFDFVWDKQVHLLDNFVKYSGQWYLAAAGTTGVLPPDLCTRLWIYDMNRTNDCMYNTLNHTVFPARVFKMFGFSKHRIPKIRTVGPVIAFTLKEMTMPYKLYRPEAVFSLACWDRKTHVVTPYNYVIMPTDQDVTNVHPFIYLVGTRTRYPHPEIEIGLWTVTKQPINVVKTYMDTYNKASWRYFLEYDELLPPMKLRCTLEPNEWRMKGPAVDSDELPKSAAWLLGQNTSLVRFVKNEAIDMKNLLDTQYIQKIVCKKTTTKTTIATQNDK